MSDISLLTPDRVGRAITWITSRGIEVRSWPPAGAVDPPDHRSQPERERADDRRPVLHIVSPGVEPPPCDELEDWVRTPIDVDELTARADRLIARARDLGAARTRVDEDDLLHVGDDLVVLSPLEARLVRALIGSMGRLVSRGELAAAVWPEGPPADPRALDNRVKAVRARIARLPLRIHTVHGRGLVLEQTPAWS
jgi:hypothetical protein